MPTGEVSASVYAKQRLAPVGEQLPWPALFAPLANHWLNSGQRSERRAGPPELAEPLVVAGSAVGVLICHEVAFGDLVAAHAESLIHMASDGWSQDPRAARQAIPSPRISKPLFPRVGREPCRGPATEWTTTAVLPK